MLARRFVGTHIERIEAFFVWLATAMMVVTIICGAVYLGTSPADKEISVRAQAAFATVGTTIFLYGVLGALRRIYLRSEHDRVVSARMQVNDMSLQQCRTALSSLMNDDWVDSRIVELVERTAGVTATTGVIV